MGKLYKAKCKTCGKIIRARRKDTLLRKIHKHYLKEHRGQLSRKIKQGRQKVFDNPSLQDFFTELSKSARSAYQIVSEYGERGYHYVKEVMDVVEPFLPEEIREKWRAVEAIHDAIQVLKKPIKKKE